MMRWIPLGILALSLGALFYLQVQAEKRFMEHWHYVPKPINISVNTPRLSDNPGYFLTKPKPKCQSTSVGYIFWSYTCGGK